MTGPPWGMVHQENKQKVKGTKSQPRNIINKISCMYTNVDQFHRKFPEFLIRVADERPMIIGITEVKPKNSSETLFSAEFAIDHIGEYDLPSHRNISNKIGRGI